MSDRDWILHFIPKIWSFYGAYRQKKQIFSAKNFLVSNTKIKNSVYDVWNVNGWTQMMIKYVQNKNKNKLHPRTIDSNQQNYVTMHAYKNGHLLRPFEIFSFLCFDTIRPDSYSSTVLQTNFDVSDFFVNIFHFPIAFIKYLN